MTAPFDGQVLVLLEHARVGGGTLVAADLLEQWLGQGVAARTLVLGLIDEPMRELLDRHGGVEVLELEGLVRRARALRRRLTDWSDTDVVFAVGDYCGILATATVATLRRGDRPAVVIGEHQPRPLRTAVRDARGRFAAVLTERLERALRRRSAGSVFTAVGQGPRSAVWRRSRRPGIVIPNPSRLAPAGPDLVDARLRRLADGGPVRLIVVGGVNPQKDQMTLLGALRVLDRRFTLTVVGNGDLEGLERAADDPLLRGRIDVLGARDDVVGLLDTHDVFVLSSRWETAYPLVVIEALVRGLPVVATDCSPTMRDFADPLATVTLVDVGDTAGMAAAIESVAAEPPARETLLSTGSELHDRHDPGRAAAEHLRFFARLTAR